MGRKCSVEGCLSESTRPEDTGVTFHKVPLHADIRPKWISLCRIPMDKKHIKIIYVCSRHFLRADFCSFKGKKYMLRQGVLPSVFPWDKSKLDSIKNAKKNETEDPTNNKSVKDEEELNEEQVKEEETDEGQTTTESEDTTTTTTTESANKTELPEESNIKKENVEDSLEMTKTLQNEQVIKTNHFEINSRIEVLDFNNIWYPARILEEDDEENEVLIHFEKFSTKYDEWICRDSPRLRPIQSGTTNTKKIEQYSINERCLASWSDARKFPATVTKVLSNDTYEVLFDDGFVKNLKAHRMSKSVGKPMQSSPLFDPIQSTKQERRDKKRKLNVAALFGKRQRIEHGIQDDSNKREEKSKSAASNVAVSETIVTTPKPTPTSFDEGTVFEPWVPKWHNGKPVGINSTIESADGFRKSTIVPDPRLPEGWVKHLTQRVHGLSAGKWDTVIVSPDNRRFRTRSEVKSYLEETKLMKFNWTMFDFSVLRHRSRKRELENDLNKTNDTSLMDSLNNTSKINEKSEMLSPQTTPGTNAEEEEIKKNYLKIPIVDDAYQCPIEGCGKTYRRENLAQMHVKHYHPEYTKFLPNSTPNVADLAYARTIGESPTSSKAKSTTITTPTVTPQQQQQRTITSKSTAVTSMNTSTTTTTTTTTTTSTSTTTTVIPTIKTTDNDNNIMDKKDSEIIKLLNTKLYDDKKNDSTTMIQPLPSGLPSNMYPDIKLKDLLNKSEGIPKRDDINLKTLSTTRPPVGIKTLLPVIRSDNKKQQTTTTAQDNRTTIKTNLKRKHQQQQQRGLLNETNNVDNNNSKEIIKQENKLLLPLNIEQSINNNNNNSNENINDTINNNSNNNIIIEGGQIIKLVKMKREEIINCTCGFTEEDGLMVQCDLCLCWQHAYCINIERESQVPEKYVCYICQNPINQRLSTKYLHDQDWLKLGILTTTSFTNLTKSINNNNGNIDSMKRYDLLKKSHDLTGRLFELKEFVNTLKVKLKIAEAKNHPKLYLWSKPWEKLSLPENEGTTLRKNETIEPKMDQNESTTTSIVKNNEDGVEGEKVEQNNESMLMMILKGNNNINNKEESNKIDLNNIINNNLEDLQQQQQQQQIAPPIIPQPEAAIDSADCRLNLLEHIANSELLVEERLDKFEKELNEIEENSLFTAADDCDTLRVKQTLQMLLKDLNTLQDFSHITSL